MANTDAAKNAPTSTSKTACCDPDDSACCSSDSAAVLSTEEAERLALTLKALADPVRLRLVSIIANSGEACACDFPALMNKSQPTISHHLSLLTNAGILEREQRGKWAWFKVNAQQVSGLQAAIGQACC